jgi:hypothetical protein
VGSRLKWCWCKSKLIADAKQKRDASNKIIGRCTKASGAEVEKLIRKQELTLKHKEAKQNTEAKLGRQLKQNFYWQKQIRSRQSKADAGIKSLGSSETDIKAQLLVKSQRQLGAKKLGEAKMMLMQKNKGWEAVRSKTKTDNWQRNRIKLMQIKADI